METLGLWLPDSLEMLKSIASKVSAVLAVPFWNTFKNLLEQFLYVIYMYILDSCWGQATLLIRLGGLGLRESCRSSFVAFLGSCSATQALSQRLMNTDLSITFNSSQNAFPDISGKVFAQELLQELLPDHEFKPEIDIQHSSTSIIR